MGFRGTGAAGAGQLRLKWRRFSPALTPKNAFSPEIANSAKTATVAQRPHRPESEARLDSEWGVNIPGILAALTGVSGGHLRARSERWRIWIVTPQVGVNRAGYARRARSPVGSRLGGGPDIQ